MFITLYAIAVKKITGILFFLFSGGLVLAQIPGSFRHLTVNDGINEAKVSSIAQDKYGNMWFGGAGLNRYNGQIMVSYRSDINDNTSLPDMNVRRIYCSRSGNLYISTYTGFCRYDYLHDNFQRLPFGINARDSRIFETADGILWMNSDKGLVTVNEKTNTVTNLVKHTDTLIRKIAAIHITDFADDGNGNIYLASSQGFFIINYKTWNAAIFVHDDRNMSSIRSNDVHDIAIDKKGMVWMSIDYYGSALVQFDPQKKLFTYFDQMHTDREEWIDNRILDLMTDDNNRLWISTLRSSLVLFDMEKKTFEYFLHDDMNPFSISSNTVYASQQDKDGGIWLAASNSGVDYFVPGSNRFYTIGKSSFQNPTLADSWCQALAEDKDGNVWIGTHRGLSYYNTKQHTFRNYFLAQSQSSVTNNSIRSLLADDDGTVWIGTGNGLSRYSNATGKIEVVNKSDSIPAVFINYLGYNLQKQIMAGTTGGIYLYKKELKRFEKFGGNHMPSSYKSMPVYTAMQNTKGIYWISLSHRGLLRYDEKNGDVKFFSFAEINPQSVSLDYITSIAEDRSGVMWFSSNNGLIAYNDERKIFTRWYEKDGLSSNKTSGLLVDPLNRLWIGTAKGLCMLDAERKSFYTYDEKDGLSTFYFYEGPAYKLSSGNFAYLTYNGVLIFNPMNIQPRHQLLQPSLTSIKVLGKDIAKSIPVRELKGIELQAGQNFFTIEMETLNYSAPSKTYFAYKLEGFSKDWVYTKDRIVNFTNVPGGSYTFRYKTATDNKNWNVPEKHLAIFIATVFYKTTWFWLLTGLLVVLIVFGIVRYRFIQQKKMLELENKAGLLEKEKTLVQYENLKQHLNPHFLFNSLTSLRSLIRVDQEHAVDFLEKMSKIYRYMLKSQDAELVSLKDEINFAQTYIELQKTRFRNSLFIHINVDEEQLHHKVVPVTLQNLIDNAIKHNLADDETPLVVNIFEEDGYLIVKNNLQKKEFVETSNKQGLKNMRSLYRYLDNRPMQVIEDKHYFTIKIPLI